MESMAPSHQPVSSDSECGQPATRTDLSEQVQGLWREARGLAHDHLQLAALETRRAGESLVTMIAAGVLIAGLVITAWLGLVAAAILLLSSLGILGILATVSAVLLAVVVNLFMAFALWVLIRRQSRHLAFSASGRSLQTTSPEPAAPEMP